MNMDTLVTVKEAAKALGMSPGSLYRMAKAGMIPSYAAGMCRSGVRVSVQELRETLKRRTEKTDKAEK